MGGAGYDISASGSQSISATAGNKVGPVTFAPVTIGDSGKGSSSYLPLLAVGGLVAALLGFLFMRN